MVDGVVSVDIRNRGFEYINKLLMTENWDTCKPSSGCSMMKDLLSNQWILFQEDHVEMAILKNWYLMKWSGDTRHVRLFVVAGCSALTSLSLMLRQLNISRDTWYLMILLIWIGPGGADGVHDDGGEEQKHCQNRVPQPLPCLQVGWDRIPGKPHSAAVHVGITFLDRNHCVQVRIMLEKEDLNNISLYFRKAWETQDTKVEQTWSSNKFYIKFIIRSM